MKKFIIALISMIVGLAAFAENVLCIGGSIAIEKNLVAEKDYLGKKDNGYLFLLKDYFIFDNKFCLFSEIGIGEGGGRSNIVTSKFTANGVDFGGLVIDINLGIGYPILKSERIKLITSAFIGFNYKDYESFQSDYVTISSFAAGVDIDFNIRLGKRFGLFAGLKFEYLIGNVNVLVDNYESSININETYTLQNFGIAPNFGFSITF